ncbi:HAD superfamily hydrolase (TIGR01509 family)/HAD superfamily hydrolase (TIGR01549 family) [Sinobacterium caligoides]|uniref:HAD superfamily hydrolase (TIGR01509 family)/HAD superfamily hydrolase (TIGR01549 family) n=1 Tax=Sinobacterium caligoides TaxID=933926 RepID=A0A3N2DDW6_9GAMM|nr:HAD family hydrolase [Sinobacterium caligoides]ROR97979.1 HAD superfamily hydrolase (TIGR01509 family)/HAD superfamily hydrolase (TIGR01549 family) [Sinobacterium caligoides]
MLKALLLDLDETLCDTTGANRQALAAMAERACDQFVSLDAALFSQRYLSGIYRDFDAAQSVRYLPVVDEAAFRVRLIRDLLDEQGGACAEAEAEGLQRCFDEARQACFNFFPGIKAKLIEWRQRYTLVVITNGPEFSQLAKVAAVSLGDYVDHIIIGGQEPEQKPAPSIFAKALRLANCSADEAIHIGDSLAADIQGANDSGIRSLWVSHGTGNDSGVMPSDVVASPAELIAFVDALAEQ